MPILKVKDPVTGEWVQVGVSTEAQGAQIAAHNASLDAHQDIRQAISELRAASVAATETSTVFMTKVTLPASNWDAGALTQTVSVKGILADDTKQLIQAVPAPASMAAATEAGVYCSGQGNGSLSFACESVPAEDIVFNVSYQAATFVS